MVFSDVSCRRSQMLGRRKNGRQVGEIAEEAEWGEENREGNKKRRMVMMGSREGGKVEKV